MEEETWGAKAYYSKLTDRTSIIRPSSTSELRATSGDAKADIARMAGGMRDLNATIVSYEFQSANGMAIAVVRQTLRQRLRAKRTVQHEREAVKRLSLVGKENIENILSSTCSWLQADGHPKSRAKDFMAGFEDTGEKN